MSFVDGANFIVLEDDVLFPCNCDHDILYINDVKVLRHNSITSNLKRVIVPSFFIAQAKLKKQGSAIFHDSTTMGIKVIPPPLTRLGQNRGGTDSCSTLVHQPWCKHVSHGC